MRRRAVEKRGSAVVAKPKLTEEPKLETEEPKLTIPVTVGNPKASASSLAIDQSHMEEFANAEEMPSDVECRRPPKGHYFTVYPELVKPWQNRNLYFLLQMEGRDPYLVAPAVAQQRADEDTIRPVLIVRYVTMGGEEGLWPLKLNPAEGRSNRWNTSALNILEIAESGKWVRLVNAGKSFRHQVSPRTFEETPPKYSDRSFDDLINEAFKDRIVVDLDHEIWDVLDQGSDK
jgi:hypothetical protein